MEASDDDEYFRRHLHTYCRLQKHEVHYPWKVNACHDNTVSECQHQFPLSCFWLAEKLTDPVAQFQGVCDAAKWRRILYEPNINMFDARPMFNSSTTLKEQAKCPRTRKSRDRLHHNKGCWQAQYYDACVRSRLCPMDGRQWLLIRVLRSMSK
eukprot:6238692-Amphidinium_carterae.1